MNNPKTVLWLLRVALASVFLYAAIAATLQPYNWIGYIPLQIRAIAPATSLLLGFSAFQFLLTIWILSAWKTRYAAGVAAITIAAILVTNAAQLDILFRDLAIFFAAIALIVGSEAKKK